MTIKVTGMKELAAILNTLPDKTARRVLQSAVTGTIRPVRKEIVNASPAGLEPSAASAKYGSLKKNIRVVRMKPLNRFERAARIDTGNAFWALFYELGTRFQPARPFFHRVFMAAKDRMINELSKRLKAGIDKEFEKMAAKK